MIVEKIVGTTVFASASMVFLAIFWSRKKGERDWMGISLGIFFAVCACLFY